MEETQTKEQASGTRKKVKKLEPNYQVLVANNTSGKLIYVSPRTQNQWLFEKHGDEDYIELFELQTMKSNAQRFFRDNWIIVKDQDAFDFLKLDNFYKNVCDPEDLDDLFTKPLDEINREIDNASPNIRSLIISKAREKFASGELTNHRVIKLIESKLEVQLDIENTLET